MRLAPLDLAIIIGYVVAAVLIGLYVSRRATASYENYFLAGRTLPWWLAGTSMIASAFAIDTPLGITGFVSANGIQGVWFAWAYIIGGAGTFSAFIFAALLRRSKIITPAELAELRYSGRGAAILRGFKGVYFGVLALSIQMGWVFRSVLVLAQEALGWDALPTMIVVVLITIVYTTLSGFWGVTVTDFIQFFIGTAGSLLLAYYAMSHIGGFDGLFSALDQRYGAAEAARRLQFLPRPDSSFFYTFLVFISLKWWGNPSAALTQRILSTKDERHAAASQLLFTVVHFALNYWPMILVALVSLAAYPDLPESKAEVGYALLLVRVLPSGVLGLMLASLAAAFMSTVDTQANTGASFMVNDIYRRFIKREASDRHYVRASQVCTVLMLLIAVGMAYFISSVREAWEVLATLTAGYGFIAVARWFWWRINAWSEIASLAGSGLGSLLANHPGLLRPLLHTYGRRFSFTAAVSTVSWVTVAKLTAPTTMEQLGRFCRTVKPFPFGWGPVVERFDDIDWSPDGWPSTRRWGLGMVLVFSLCFCVGNLLLGSRLLGVGLGALAALALAGLRSSWRRSYAQ